MSVFFLVRLLTAYGWIRLMSDMSRLEAKVERLTDQLASKERELQALTSKVFSQSLDLVEIKGTVTEDVDAT
jgi:hypothetical protein